MGWLDDVVSSLQQGGAPFAMAPASPFPDVPGPVTEEQQAAAAQAARDAAGARLIRANQRRVDPFGIPDMNSAGVQLALGQGPAGTGVPGVIPGPGPADGSPFGAPPSNVGALAGPTIPPSMQLAGQMAAPPAPAVPPGAPVPMPAPRPAAAGPGANGVVAPEPNEEGDVPTDLSARKVGTPVAPPVPPIAGAPALPQIKTPGIGDALLGIGGALSGDGGAATMAIRKGIDAQNTDLLQRNATAKLLQSKGATVPEIQAAIAGGPDTVKQLLGQYLGKDKFSVVKTGETVDQYGAKKAVYSVFNQTDGTFKNIPASSAEDAKATAQAQASDTTGLSGGAAMEKLRAADPKYANQVQAIIDGREAFPTGRQAQTPIGRKLIQDVFAVDGSASESDFKNRAAIRKRYTSGKDFDITKSINTVVKHGQELQTAIDDLHNFSTLPGFLNPVTGKIAEQYDQKYQAALGRFKQNADTFARDYDFAVSGGRPTVSGRQAQRELFDEYGSPAKNNGALQKSMELLNDRLTTHLEGYRQGMLPNEANDLVPALDPNARDFIRRYAEMGHGGGARPAAAAPATGPLKPGAYVWDPKTGGLVPK